MRRTRCRWSGACNAIASRKRSCGRANRFSTWNTRSPTIRRNWARDWPSSTTCAASTTLRVAIRATDESVNSQWSTVSDKKKFGELFKIIGQAKPEPRHEIDYAKLRARFADAKGPKYWRTLEELADDPQFRAALAEQFP